MIIRNAALFLLSMLIAYPAIAAPTVSVNGSTSPVTVAAGASITATVANGPGDPGDWLAVYAVGAPIMGGPGNRPSWKWLSTDDAKSTVPPKPGVAAGIVHLVVPAEAGQYEVRLFTANSTNMTAKSAAIAVDFGFVTSITGAGHVTCAPATGNVVCKDTMARGTPAAGSTCNDGDNFFDTNRSGTTPTVTFYFCDASRHWLSVGTLIGKPY